MVTSIISCTVGRTEMEKLLCIELGLKPTVWTAITVSALCLCDRFFTERQQWAALVLRYLANLKQCCQQNHDSLLEIKHLCCCLIIWWLCRPVVFPPSHEESKATVFCHKCFKLKILSTQWHRRPYIMHHFWLDIAVLVNIPDIRWRVSQQPIVQTVA